MDAAAWTAIAILAATSFGTLFYLGARIDALGARSDGLALEQHVDPVRDPVAAHRPRALRACVGCTPREAPPG